MTPKFKEIILEQINRVRSDVAMGKYNNTNIKQILPTASNMRLKRWNNDFEELAKMAVLKLNGKLGDYCFTTGNRNHNINEQTNSNRTNFSFFVFCRKLS